MSLKSVLTLVVLVSALAPQTSNAQIIDPPTCVLRCASAHTRVEPAFALYKTILERSGPQSPFFGPTVDPYRVRPRQDGVGATLRVTQPLSTMDIWSLERAGVVFAQHDEHGWPAHLGLVYRAWVPFDALDHLKRLPSLLRAEVAWHPLVVSPLDVTSAEVGAAQAHHHPKVGVTGKGVVVADIDSGVDVLHPAFFHADGGHFPWIDVDGSGAFEPGVDAIDYNQNGKADRFEIARLLEGSTISYFSDRDVDNQDNRLDATQDWVYIDANADFRRNAGVLEGFLEVDPAYGEPIFVVDDVNGNNRLDVHEKLVLLKTSKILKYIDVRTSYLRGVNLIEAAQADGLEHSFHGTAVSGILLGGQRTFHHRIGLAPDASLIMYGYIGDTSGEAWSDSLQAAFVQDAVDSGADMILHEWTNPFVRPMDGSTNLEAMMDAARAQGIMQVNPLGNLNRSEKHIERTLNPGDATSLSFEVKGGYQYLGRVVPYAVAYSSLQWRAERAPTITVKAPDGQRVLLTHDPNTIHDLAGALVTSTIERTTRGTTLVVIYIYSPDQTSSLMKGTWSYDIKDVQEETTIFGRVADYYSNWNVGIRWEEDSPNTSTLSFPSTADSAIGVAAYGGRQRLLSDGSAVGQLRGYSGRGPRVDGQHAVDIAAPDDPFAPLAALPSLIDVGYGPGWYMTFGGTSGAAPHVAAALALSLEQDAMASVDEREARLFASARTASLEPFTPQPNALPSSHWGFGKLNVFGMLHDEPLRENTQPIARAAATGNRLELTLDATSSTDEDGDTLQARFDLDYDGIYDVPWGPLRAVIPLSKLREPEQNSLIKVQVRDPQGATASALVWFLPNGPISTMDDGGDMGDMSLGDMVDTPLDMGESSYHDGSCVGQCAQSPGSPQAPMLVMIALMVVGIIRRHHAERL